MADEHTHDTDGRTNQNTMTIGDELVTYKQVFCTCGVLQQNNVIQRVHIAPRKSPENEDK